MTDEKVLAKSKYDILETVDRTVPGRPISTFAIIHLDVSPYDVDQTRSKYKFVVPDAGEEGNARLLLKWYRQREREANESAEKREEAFQESLKGPHLYTKQSNRNLECWCGKAKDDEIHIKMEEIVSEEIDGP